MNNDIHNKNFTYEELLYSLPDYITGSLNDSTLENAIKSRLESDASFKTEYDELSSLLGFIKTTEFSEPPAGYFNNFLPILREKLEKDKVGIMHTFNFSRWIKYALPVVTILIITFIYIYRVNNLKNSVTRDSSQLIVSGNNSLIQSPVNNSTESTIEILPDTDEAINELDDIIYTEPIKKSVVRQRKSAEVTQVNTAEFSVTDLLDSYHEIQEDYNYEKDFSKLSTKEQSDLISNLMKEKF